MPAPVSKLRTKVSSAVMHAACIACAALIISILLLVVYFLVSIGGRYITFSFFTQDPQPYGSAQYPGGMRNGLIGTVMLIGLASVGGVPLGILGGIYLSEYHGGSWLTTPVRFTADVLAGVPSIVVGILGYELLVVPIGHFNGWAGALALGFIMVPIVMRTTEEMLRLVPNSYREASIALGATKARTIMKVVLPAASGSLVTGVMLAVARVAGETAPLLFTALGSRLLTLNPDYPFPSLTKQIYDYATGPYQEQKQQAWAGILVLLLLIFVLNVGVRWAVNAASRSMRPTR
ncbi:MAG TPA: phosphate ABC transporter permease PstA [Tepidisphaeraceae bacterium]|jgi:phosphate transport system permease protein|nr:phosphate ABC transporter permease PstA [Tepidisphaeraceae bacterium]